MEAILWRHPATGTLERCTLGPTASGQRLAGTLVGEHKGAPIEIRYVIQTDTDWRTRDVGVYIVGGQSDARLALKADGAGHWTLDEGALPDLDGALDVDLGFTPATNTLAIKRLDLAVGETGTARAVWIGLPGEEVEAFDQTYERVEADRYQYRAGSYVNELSVNAGGLVIAYPGEWEMVAVSG